MFHEETYLLFILKTYQLTYCQKCSNLQPELSTQANYTIELEDIIINGNYYPKCIAELDVLCNLEDLDFNRAICPTT